MGITCKDVISSPYLVFQSALQPTVLVQKQINDGRITLHAVPGDMHSVP